MTSNDSGESVRPEVRRLASWAPIPPEDNEFWQEGVIDSFAADIAAVSPPLTALERDVLLVLLQGSDDSVYGVLWGVLHLIETAPNDGYELHLPTSKHPWYQLLLTRRINAGQGKEPVS